MSMDKPYQRPDMHGISGLIYPWIDERKEKLLWLLKRCGENPECNERNIKSICDELGFLVCMNKMAKISETHDFVDDVIENLKKGVTKNNEH